MIIEHVHALSKHQQCCLLQHRSTSARIQSDRFSEILASASVCYTQRGRGRDRGKKRTKPPFTKLRQMYIVEIKFATGHQTCHVKTTLSRNLWLCHWLVVDTWCLMDWLAQWANSTVFTPLLINSMRNLSKINNPEQLPKVRLNANKLLMLGITQLVPIIPTSQDVNDEGLAK